MQYDIFKEKVLGLFEPGKLDHAPDEWAFSNELHRDIYSIALAVSLTPHSVTAAQELGAQVLLTHHDAGSSTYDMRDACYHMLQVAAISHAFFQSPLDDASFGTAASLALRLGLEDMVPVFPHKKVFWRGMMGLLPEPLSFEGFRQLVEEVLSTEIRSFQNKRGLIRKVCVAPGGANYANYLHEAAASECDAYLTGEYVLHNQMYARFARLNLLVGSHIATERPALVRWGELLGLATGCTVHLVPEPLW